MRSSATTAGANAQASQYNDLRKDAYGGSMLLVHEQASPNMTVYVEPGVAYVGATRVIYAGGNSPSITNPVTNPRIDLITIDSAGTIAVTAGTEAASPSAPAYPANKLVLAEIYLRTTGTTIRDTDQGSGHYIKNDVRPFLGGAYIASNAQVAAGSNIQPSKLDSGNVDADWLPDADNTRKLGSSTRQWSEMRAVVIYQNGAALGSAKFGGTGSDGALSISSGTTTVSLASAQFVELNYTSISITGTASLAFSNPHANGSIVIIKCQGACTITSSNPGIDLSGMGAAGGAGVGTQNTAGNAGTLPTTSFRVTQTGAAGLGGATGGGSGKNGVAYPSGGSCTTTTAQVSFHQPFNVVAGAGGGSGSVANGGSGSSGAGGRGGGGLYLEVGGAINFTGTIKTSGANGADGTGNSGSGGGGGSAGTVLVLYNTLTSVSGTITATGGNGGTSVNNGYGNGGGGGAGSALAAGGDCSGGSQNGFPGSQGSGGGGTCNFGGTARTGGAGGTGGASLVAKNNYFS